MKPMFAEPASARDGKRPPPVTSTMGLLSEAHRQDEEGDSLPINRMEQMRWGALFILAVEGVVENINLYNRDSMNNGGRY